MFQTHDPCTPDVLLGPSWGEFVQCVVVIVLVLGIAAALYLRGHALSDAVMNATMAVVIASTAAKAVVRGAPFSPPRLA